MLLGFNAIELNPTSPSRRFGPGDRSLTDVKGDLIYKLFVLKKEGHKPYLNVSCPLTDIEMEHYQVFKKKLEEELEELKTVKRPEIAARLRHAIEQGDISENADYSSAKEDQGFMEGRIQELEKLLSNVEENNKRKKPVPKALFPPAFPPAVPSHTALCMRGRSYLL